MRNNTLISVIVPVYKVEAYLNRCVQSILDQTYRNLDIILVDDGSPDNCPLICDAWAEKDSRIRVIHKANGGLSDARNAGMSVANGDCIAFIDSDDWIAPEMLERLLLSMEQTGSDISACAVEMVWEDDTPNQLLTVQRRCVLDHHEAQTELLKERLLKQPVWYKLYRKETIGGIPFEVGKYHEDVFWSYQVVGNAKRVSLIDYIGYFYLQRAGSIMGEGYTLRRLDVLEAAERRYDYFIQNFPDLATEARLKIRYACIYHGQMTLRYLRGKERNIAMRRLCGLIKKYKISLQQCSDEKLSHKIWLCTSEVSLFATCMVKNCLNVGF